MDKNLFNSPITYVYGSNLEECHKVIADLEAKLAVADDCADRYWKQIGVLEEENKKLKEFIEKRENCNEWLTMKDNENLQYEVNQLKHQLAEKEKEKEKEKELEYYKKQTKKFNNEAQKYFEDAYCNDFHTQDKISFCIEQLEKVKEEIGNKIDIWHLEGTLGTGTVDVTNREVTLTLLNDSVAPIVCTYYPKYSVVQELDIGHYVLTKMFAVKFLQALAALRAQATQEDLHRIDLTTDDLNTRVQELKKEVREICRSTISYGDMAPM